MSNDSMLITFSYFTITAVTITTIVSIVTTTIISIAVAVSLALFS